MKINNNISAVVSNKHLLRNENSLSVSMERLSSGFKINHAGDSPSGMAISAKMRAQIRGLDQASDNAADGTSVLETADGALNEVHSIIQRMRELSVQSANGTNSLSDRQSIQQEINSLRDEVQRISDSTEFNTKKLLDGSLDKRVYTEGVSRVTLGEVPEGNYEFIIKEPPTHSVLESEMTWDDLANYVKQYAGEDSPIVINEESIVLMPEMSAEDMYMLVRDTAERGEAEVSSFENGQGKIKFTSIGYGVEARLDIEMPVPMTRQLGIERQIDAVYPENNFSWNDLESYVKVNGTADININGSNITLDSGMSGYDMFLKITESLPPGVETVGYGSGENSVYFEQPYDKANRLSVTFPDKLKENFSQRVISEPDVVEGKNAEIELVSSKTSLFSNTATFMTPTKVSGDSAARATDGLRIRFTDVNDFKIDLLLDADKIDTMNKLIDQVEEYQNAVANPTLENADFRNNFETEEFTKDYAEVYQDYLSKQIAYNNDNSDANKLALDNAAQALDAAYNDLLGSNLQLQVKDIGPMNLQIGANEGQQMEVRIASINVETLYLDQVDVTTQRGATRALEQLDEVLASVSANRSSIGAYANRLEHAIASLDQTSENMNQALSRIEDDDVAKEMTEYTKYNVLQQAATSALSQANELPQTALQLLQ